MKRILIHTVLMLVILESTSLTQLVKIPFLAIHFIEHKDLDERLGFVDFLYMHYWGNDLNDNDDDKDMQLPFKKYELASPTFLFVRETKVILKPSYFSVEPELFGDRPQFYFNPAGDSPFRPPRA